MENFNSIDSVRSTRRAKLQRGFALFELFLALVVLVTIAGLVLPTLSSQNWQQEKERFVGKIRLSLLHTRQMAITRGQPTIWYPPNESDLLLTTSIVTHPKDITFLPDGTSQDAQILLSISDAEVASLRIIGATGAITFSTEDAL